MEGAAGGLDVELRNRAGVEGDAGGGGGEGGGGWWGDN